MKKSIKKVPRNNADIRILNIHCRDVASLYNVYSNKGLKPLAADNDKGFQPLANCRQ